MVRTSAFPIQTYTQLIGLSHALRVALPPLVTELSFLPDRACSVVASSGVSQCECDCLGLDMSDPLPGALPSADVFARLVGPCTSLRRLELGDLVECGLPNDFSDDGATPHPPWIKRAFSHNGTALRSLSVLDLCKRDGFAVEYGFVAHMLACLPDLEELHIDVPLSPAALIRWAPPLRALRVRQLPAPLAEWLLADPPPLAALKELHVEEAVAPQVHSRAAQLGLALSPPQTHFCADPCGHEDTSARSLKVWGGTSGTAFRLRCPALHTFDWCARSAPPLDVDAATAAALHSLCLDAACVDVRLWITPFVNLRLLVLGPSPSIAPSDVRCLCEDATWAPRLAVLSCTFQRPPAGEWTMFCKDSLVDLRLLGCFRLQLILAGSPSLMRLQTNAGHVLLRGVWRRLVSLSVSMLSVEEEAGGGANPGTEAMSLLPALRQICCAIPRRVQGTIGVLELARRTLRCASFRFGESVAAPDEAAAFVAFVSHQLPWLASLSMFNLPVGLSVDVRLPALRRLTLEGLLAAPGFSPSSVRPLVDCPGLEEVTLKCLALPAPRILLPRHFSSDGRLRLTARVSMPWCKKIENAWGAVGASVLPSWIPVETPFLLLPQGTQQEF